MGFSEMIYDSFISENKFSDINNFPNGFQKTSLLTQIEADVLGRCGYKMMQLYNGEIEPENEDQRRFSAVAKGQIKPLYHIEYVFLKYISLIHKEDKILA